MAEARKLRSVCAMTTVRNDALFLPRWIAH